MREPAPVPWDQLSESARSAVVWWIRQLAQGATGTVSFTCQEGGVRRVTEEVVVERYEDGSRQVRVRRYRPDELESAA